MPNRELSVVVMPNGTLQTEWIEITENIKQSSRLLQEEIFNRFVADADAGLLFLGFCDKNVVLSPSLEYWRDFAGLFTRELSRTPELELFRHQTHIVVDKQQLDHFTHSAPLMPGSEYISTELLRYESDRDKLLELLATVHLAAEQSPLLAQLLDTGELFHPMTWSTAQAFSFLKEVAVYENCGILCRIPNWWQGKSTRVGINISFGDTKRLWSAWMKF